MDHRKGRRNRATQSCLHCHTNKRKCDRKRPCQRCTQMGMTGLCIYEVEDPNARHDPSVAETTRLRNRIAELEILVRELRGVFNSEIYLKIFSRSSMICAQANLIHDGRTPCPNGIWARFGIPADVRKKNCHQAHTLSDMTPHHNHFQ
ncbi:hypothetical protein BD410DRAFT_718059 [Rickenella mellea]|uniref:Zn(2)-C6 fungal-type domain-containing protein n=1 Tax=Rickenella mellea TaxID=50990 RepID=A0A4Y7QE68_9AGAM|nr:hypothetical protein BD410DRAFT_718059 [Rickenella mellea]